MGSPLKPAQGLYSELTDYILVDCLTATLQPAFASFPPTLRAARHMRKYRSAHQLVCSTRELNPASTRVQHADGGMRAAQGARCRAPARSCPASPTSARRWPTTRARWGCAPSGGATLRRWRVQRCARPGWALCVLGVSMRWPRQARPLSSIIENLEVARSHSCTVTQAL